MNEEIRYYKGRYKVKVVQKSRKNWMVEALEEIPLVPSNIKFGLGKSIFEGETFVTVPRLLWKHKKLRKFIHGKLYRFKEDYYYKQPYPLKSGLIPKGTVVRFDCPNLGFARFIFQDIKLTEKFNDYAISLKPKDAFRVLEEIEVHE